MLELPLNVKLDTEIARPSPFKRRQDSGGGEGGRGWHHVSHICLHEPWGGKTVKQDIMYRSTLATDEAVLEKATFSMYYSQCLGFES